MPRRGFVSRPATAFRMNVRRLIVGNLACVYKPFLISVLWRSPRYRGIFVRSATRIRTDGVLVRKPIIIRVAVTDLSLFFLPPKQTTRVHATPFLDGSC